MSTTVAAALHEARERLKAAGIASPATDASALMGAAAGGNYLSYDVLPSEIERKFIEFVTRRETREPVSQILERRAFWTHNFKITSDVLDPRPDTETLVECALAYQFENVLDLGTGSGCILLSLLSERPNARGLGVDISDAALEIARQNAQKLGLVERVSWQCSNWFEGISGSFDLIVSNPPYISAAAYENLAPELQRFEPKCALTSGGDGLQAYRDIAAVAQNYLTPNGLLLFEIGFDQGKSVEQILDQAGWSSVSRFQDLAGKDRVIAAKLG